MACPAFTSRSGFGGSEGGSGRVSRNRFAGGGAGEAAASGSAEGDARRPRPSATAPLGVTPGLAGGADPASEALGGSDEWAPVLAVSEAPGSPEGALCAARVWRSMAWLEGRPAG